MVPVPTLVSPPAPAMSPAKVVEALLPPVVSVPAPSATPLPATPASEPIVWSLPLMSRVAPLTGMLTAVVAGRYWSAAAGDERVAREQRLDLLAVEGAVEELDLVQLARRSGRVPSAGDRVDV